MLHSTWTDLTDRQTERVWLHHARLAPERYRTTFTRGLVINSSQTERVFISGGEVDAESSGVRRFPRLRTEKTVTVMKGDCDIHIDPSTVCIVDARSTFDHLLGASTGGPCRLPPAQERCCIRRSKTHPACQMPLHPRPHDLRCPHEKTRKQRLQKLCAFQPGLWNSWTANFRDPSFATDPMQFCNCLN